MLDITQLSHLRSSGEELEKHPDHYRIHVVGIVKPTVCPDCKSDLYRHGSKVQVYADIPMYGKPVLLQIARKRYRCKSCGKVFPEPLPDIDSKRDMTERLVRYIEERCLRETFSKLSREVGVADNTISNIFEDYVAEKKKTVHFETPTILGIDELKIIKEYRCMLTNIEKSSIFDLLPSRKKIEVSAYLKALPDKQNIKVVTMDMWNPYRQAVSEQLPGRLCVADKFHVTRMANEALEKVRKAIRQGLDHKTRIQLKDERFILLKRHAEIDEAEKIRMHKWFDLFPALRSAHEAKEHFFAIYDHRDRQDAEAAAKEWEKRLPSDVSPAFRDLSVALKNWWNEIFNYYEFPVTNAYTESVNRIAKDINRMGRGYSFDVIRAKLLYEDTARNKTRKTLQRKVRREIPSMGFSLGGGATPKMYETVIEEITVEYGPHIPTLCDLLESGYFD